MKHESIGTVHTHTHTIYVVLIELKEVYAINIQFLVIFSFIINNLISNIINGHLLLNKLNVLFI